MIVPSEKESDKTPDFRIFAGATEFGAAWKKAARRARIPLRQARRSELPGSDLREPGRIRLRLLADLVAPARRLIPPDQDAPLFGAGRLSVSVISGKGFNCPTALAHHRHSSGCMS